MTLNFSTLKTNLYNWAVENIPVGMPVIYYFANSPRPETDYLSLYLASFVQIDWDYTQQPTDDTGISQMVGDREFTLQCQAYGTNSMQVLENLRTSLQKQTVLDTLRVNGIVFVNWFPINDTTQLLNSRFEIRAQMDILFRIAQQYSDNLGVINTVV